MDKDIDGDSSLLVHGAHFSTYIHSPDVHVHVCGGALCLRVTATRGFGNLRSSVILKKSAQPKQLRVGARIGKCYLLGGFLNFALAAH